MAHWKPYHVLLVILISIQVAPGYRLAKANAPLAIPMQSSGNVAEIVSTLTSPTIDGAIDEIWQSANRYDLTNQLLGDSPLASSNLSASFRSLYDANKLYFLIEVVDDVKINDSEENPNFDDTVEIYLDGNFSRGLAYDNLDDRVTLFRWDDSEPHASSLSPPLPNGLESAIVDTSTGYRVEVAFPFSQIRIKPMPGYQFGLDVHALDDDDGGDKDNKLAWNGTEDDVWQNPSLMGIGRLGPPPEPPLIAEISGTLDTPTIDGTIDSTWLSAATYPIQKLVVGTESVAAPDLAGSFRALHDSINLYLLVEVIDDSLNNDSTTIFHDDVVDIYLDGNKSRGDAYDGVDDRQIWFRWNDSTPHAGAESAPVPLGIEHLSVLTGNGYRTEISIPLNQAGIAYAEGVEFGFDVHIHDDDQGGNRDHKIAWNAWTDYAWTKPTLMGLGRLGAMPIPNRRPVANDDLASTANTQVLQGSNLLANDSDPDGDSLTISTTPVSAPSHGTLVINPDGTFRYTPDTNFVGDDSFTYQISDGRGGSDTAEVIITVTQGNRLPVANDDSASTANTQVLQGSSVLANDSDPDGDELTTDTVPVSVPSHGTLVINPDGTFRYTPDTNFVGDDSFTYQISDGRGGSATAEVTITVTQGNRLPVANDDSASTANTQALLGSNLLANDSDPDGDELTIDTVPVSAPSHGTLVINPDGTFRYTPDTNFVGDDSFTYQISDGRGGSDTAEVIITVTQGNRLPVANDDSASTANTQVLQGSSVLANDSDPDGDELTIDTVPVSAPSHGTLVINPDGTFRYTPNASFIGDDSFTYQISDGRGGSATAEVTITVTQGNRAPVARDDRAILVQDQVLNGENLLANDSDPEGDALSINTVPIVNTKHGTLVINADGSFIYTPNGGYLGTDTFTYQLMDSNGSRDTANVIIVIDVNRQPVASDYSVIVARDQVYQGASLLSNASDPNGDRLVVSTTPAAEPSQGTLVLREDGTFRYMPNSGFEGFDSFTYQVIDSHGSSSTGTVIIVVTASSIAVTPETPETPVSVSPTPVPETPTPEPSTLETPTPVGPTPEIPVPETPMPNDGNHDKDNDGIPDDVEGQGDMDGDMIPNSEDEDSDGDGTPDRIEGIVDANQNGLRDFLDPSINTVAYLPISGVQTRDE